MANSITLSWTKDELVTYISNLSAYVAQSLALSGDIAFDANTLTKDNEETFLNAKITEAVNALVPHFSRIIADNATIVSSEQWGVVFTPRIEGGTYSQAELSYVKTLCRKIIACYVLTDWYSMKGIAAMNNYFATQYVQSGNELNVVLDRFVRPVRKASVSIGRVTYAKKDSTQYTHINNRSDFALVWGTANGAPLPNGEYDIDFYTDGEVVRSFNSLDTALVKPIEGANNRVRIIFDFSDGSYFANGVLKYTMHGHIQDADFPDGERCFEQSGETTIEIWDGASDTDNNMKALYVPSYMKLEFSDLSESDIAVLQAPALEAAKKAQNATLFTISATGFAEEATLNAKTATNDANLAAREAYIQATFAKSKGEFADQKGKEAEASVLLVDKKIEEVTTLEQNIGEAEAERVLADENRRVVFAEKIAESEKATASANSAAARAEVAIEQVPSILDSVTKIEEELLKKQGTLNLTVLDNGNIRISNLEGGSKDFMPATPSGDPMHYYYLSFFGVSYNENTGFFELGYLKDLTAQDMANAVRVSGNDFRMLYNNASSINSLTKAKDRPRTNLPVLSGTIKVSRNNFPRWQTSLEQFVIGKNSSGDIVRMTDVWNNNDGFVGTIGLSLAKLKYIIGIIEISSFPKNTGLKNFIQDDGPLTEFNFYGLSSNQSLLLSSASKNSITYLLENRKNVDEISLSLNAVVYDKIMNEDGEWADLRQLLEASDSYNKVILEKLA